MIPGLRRSPGEGIGHPLQYSSASLVAQMVKNPLARQETWVRSLGWKDPLEESMANGSSLVAQTVKNPPANEGDPGSTPGLGRSPGGGHGNPLQYPCLENHHGQRRLLCPSGHKESDTTRLFSRASTFVDSIYS